MYVIGIDPGSQRVGFAVLEINAAFRMPKLRDIGVWELLKLNQRAAGLRPDLGSRLESLHGLASELFETWNPRWVGIEKVVHFKNAASAHVLAESRGVLRLALHQSLADAEKRLVELSPTAVKRIASGFGGANKAGMLRAMHLRFPELLELHKKKELEFDAFDALAIALSAWDGLKSKRTLGRDI